MGPRGSTGATGATGPTGPGFHFVTVSGASGPTLQQSGTYFVVVQVAITAGGTALSGECGVVASGSEFHGAFDVPVGLTQTDSFSGMLIVPSNAVPATPALTCLDSSGNPVTPGHIRWWASLVG
jgi:hypothetical protein